MLAIKKCLKKRGNFMPIACTFATKVKLLPNEKKILFSLVADSPQTIGFSGSNWQLELGPDYDKP
jgi:hypothetical protein